MIGIGSDSRRVYSGRVPGCRFSSAVCGHGGIATLEKAVSEAGGCDGVFPDVRFDWLNDAVISPSEAVSKLSRELAE